MGKTREAAGKAHTADRKLSRAIARHRDAPVVRGAGAMSELADQPPLVALSLATIAGGALLRRPGVVRTGLRMLAAHALATGIKTLVKRSVDRTRPAAALDGKGYRLEQGGSDDHDLNSFPSGHTAGAVAIARTIARDHPRAAPLAHGTAAAVAAIQLPRGAHYASDVAAGAVIGLVAEWATSAVIDAVEERVREHVPQRERRSGLVPGSTRPGSQAFETVARWMPERARHDG